MIQILHVDNIDKSDWEELLQNSTTASYFQSPECYDFFRSLSFLDTFGWAVYSGRTIKGLVCGYITANGGKFKQYLSRRAVIQGGLLLAKDITDDEISALLAVLKNSIKHKVIYLEIRNNNDYSRYRHIFDKEGFDYKPHLNYIVDTSANISKIREQYSESKKRQIRKAKEQNVICHLTYNQNDIDAFYELLKNLYKTKIKKPLFPKEFFDNFVKLSNSRLFVVEKDKTIIGGIACATLTDRVLYEWFVCGDTVNFNHLYPSVIATNSAIEFACNNGFEYFDFMGAGTPDKAYGVREFKGKFGGQLVEYGRFIYIADKILFRLGKKAIETKLTRFF